MPANLTIFDYMRITAHLSLHLLAVATLAACSAAQSESVQAPAPTTPTMPKAETPTIPKAEAPAPGRPALIQPTGEWTDWPLADGDWVYRRDDRGSIALFGPPDQNAAFMIRCDSDRRQIFLSRAGQITTAGAKMTLHATSGVQSFAAQNSGGETAFAAIAVQPNEYMLDRIIFSRGRFAIEVNGLRSIAIPIWAEFNRVVEDCRG